MTGYQRSSHSTQSILLPRITTTVTAVARMGQFGAAVSAMKCEMCFSLECYQSAKVCTAIIWEACKHKSQPSTCPGYFQLCFIYCDSTWALFVGPYHYSFNFVPCLAFCVHVAGDLNEKVSFITDVLLTSLTRVYLGSSGTARAAFCN